MRTFKNVKWIFFIFIVVAFSANNQSLAKSYVELNPIIIFLPVPKNIPGEGGHKFPICTYFEAKFSQMTNGKMKFSLEINFVTHRIWSGFLKIMKFYLRPSMYLYFGRNYKLSGDLMWLQQGIKGRGIWTINRSQSRHYVNLEIRAKLKDLINPAKSRVELSMKYGFRRNLQKAVLIIRLPEFLNLFKNYFTNGEFLRVNINRGSSQNRWGMKNAPSFQIRFVRENLSNFEIYKINRKIQNIGVFTENYMRRPLNADKCLLES